VKKSAIAALLEQADTDKSSLCIARMGKHILKSDEGKKMSLDDHRVCAEERFDQSLLLFLDHNAKPIVPNANPATEAP
jgi:hypothetical protein